MDGRALLRELRADPVAADVPVVVFSGDPGDVPDVAACVRKGRDDPDVLLKAIASCLRG
jgi:CheY-like chemotaxis protein